MITLEARQLRPPLLRFDPVIPSRVAANPFPGLRRYGPYDADGVRLEADAVLLVYPEPLARRARELVRALLAGIGNYPGFEAMFRVPLTLTATIAELAVPIPPDAPAAHAHAAYDRALREWLVGPPRPPVDLAMVIVPQSRPWEARSGYFAGKALLTAAGIPTQMITTAVAADRERLKWSVANLALAAFAKLGGVPWVVDVPDDERDLVVGVGRADVRSPAGRREAFGYAVSVGADGAYRHTWAFAPADSESTYRERLERVLLSALEDRERRSRPPARLVFHCGRPTGRAEIAAIRAAARSAGTTLPVAFVRIDDGNPYELLDYTDARLLPPKGLAVRLDERTALLQSEGSRRLAPPRAPLLIELDRRSDVGPEALDGLVEQIMRLSAANWRGFDARSRPVTLVYGERLAQLVAQLERVGAWRPETLTADVGRRPWYL